MNLDFLFKLSSFFRKKVANEECYFFLPLTNKYNTALTVTNVTQNSTNLFYFKNLYLRVWFYDKKNLIWKMVEQIKFETHVLQIFSDNYDQIKKECNLLLVTLENNPYAPRQSNNIPISFIKKNSFSPHTIRGKHTFIKGSAKSSYMGEYPKKMSLIAKGSAFSYINMFNPQPLNSTSSIFFINFSNYSNIKGVLKLIDIESNEVIYKCNCEPNSLNEISLKNKFFTNKKIILISENLVGIPIYINSFEVNNKDFITVEHSHPPAEYFFKDIYYHQSILKRNWLKRYV